MNRSLIGRVGKLVAGSAGLSVALFFVSGVCSLAEARPAAVMSRDVQVDAILARGGGAGAIGPGGVLPPTGGESVGPVAAGAVSDAATSQFLSSR